MLLRAHVTHGYRGQAQGQGSAFGLQNMALPMLWPKKGKQGAVWYREARHGQESLPLPYLDPQSESVLCRGFSEVYQEYME